MNSNLRAKIEYERSISAHLERLGHLVGRRVTPDELLDRTATQSIRTRIQAQRPMPHKRVDISFSAMRTERFRRFIAALESAAPQAIQVWTDTTEYCGLFVIAALGDFDFGFSYEDDPAGLLVLRTADLNNRLVLDFEDDDGQQRLQVEWAGAQWGALDY
ncbi:MAG: hypothetical protein RL385_1145 [Pseudomonadota bacterium]|jgi:hypothetical protein